MRALTLAADAMPHRTLPGTLVARLQDSFLLIGAIAHQAIAFIGLRALEYALTSRKTAEGSRELRRPLRPLVRFGYWMLGGITTGRWDAPPPESTFTRQP